MRHEIGFDPRWRSTRPLGTSVRKLSRILFLINGFHNSVMLTHFLIAIQFKTIELFVGGWKHDMTFKSLFCIALLFPLYVVLESH